MQIDMQTRSWRRLAETKSAACKGGGGERGGVCIVREMNRQLLTLDLDTMRIINSGISDVLSSLVTSDKTISTSAVRAWPLSL